MTVPPAPPQPPQMPELPDADPFVARAQEFAASGAAPATPRLAGTVLLLRPVPGGPVPSGPVPGEPGEPGESVGGYEVYLLRRRATMAFASGMYAFPGGTVDPGDYDAPPDEDAPAGGDGPSDDDWSALLGLSPADAGAVVRAAVRECAEETGVAVSPDALLPWTRWITPEFEPRRYDTFFFVVALPDGQDAADVSGEADRTLWLPPAEALARHRAGEMHMLPPTSVTLGELAAYPSVAEVCAAAGGRDAATPILPRVERDADGEPRFVYRRG